MEARREGLAFQPPHPGEYLREDILPELGMSVSELAKHLDISRNSASRLINEKASISLDMAVRLGQAFRNGARFWMALQMQHDLWEAERKTTIKVPPLAWGDHSAA
ncbi:HigA family addiction module antidote protein [Oceanicola sp. D3]|uniref:HigA family addiction module antitoxin n=1 Tax=Oceanicola sp. D3 TaxID=2587163 RepID=UPI0011229C89|nr:HigA family addiction module antitoxin [Oceanicola sp. D3]QDC07969.1 HigA family addiction module antidote protein [Oceanicola sp. D3]